MKIFRKLKKFKKIFRLSFWRRCEYTKYYYKEQILDNYILIDSQHGNNLNGNLFYLVKELNDNKDYTDYKVFITVTKQKYKEFSHLLISHNINNFELVLLESKMYNKLLASAKYLINDTSFPTYFIKKEGQVYLNTWHGTPLKRLGRKEEGKFFAIGNIQRNFLMSDYLLYPNYHTRDKMIEGYMLKNICNSKIIMGGYPRNSIFFDDVSRKNIRNNEQIDDKQVLVYMPTWRDNRSLEDEIKIVTKFLKKMDKKLNKNQVMYVNLHPFVNNLIKYNFKRIKPFPKKYETYEFLNAADILITDYSSVFFDFAITKRKIILYAYDEEEYLSVRGCFFSLDELPFPKVSTIEDLIIEINKKRKINYSKFIDEFCSFDDKNISSKILDIFIKNKENDLKTEEIPNNNKDNVLLYTGNLEKNGITTSLLNVIKSVDLEKKNYILTFSKSRIRSNGKNIIKNLPDNISYIVVDSKSNTSFYEKLILYFFRKRPNIKKFDIIKEIYKREIKRLFYNIDFTDVIQFNGYEFKFIIMFSLFKCNKVIYVHNDMISEAKTKSNQNVNLLKLCYENYNKIAIVNETLMNSTMSLINDKSKIFITNNIINKENILSQSKKEVAFDYDTICNISLNRLNKILDNDKYIKFINVGRFSPEKGHIRLINAFYKVWKDNKKAYLIIIGGYGKQYDEIVDIANKIECSKNIIIIKSISNPFPIIKKCDCFVLSSFYEGFGLVLVEADILGLNSFSTNIVGPKKFIKENNGNLVEDSENGIYLGMIDFINGNLKNMKVDYELYNKKSISEFYNLLEDSDKKHEK